MTDAEFVNEIKRAVMIIFHAVLNRFDVNILGLIKKAMIEKSAANTDDGREVNHDRRDKSRSKE